MKYIPTYMKIILYAIHVLASIARYMCHVIPIKAHCASTEVSTCPLTLGFTYFYMANKLFWIIFRYF